MDARKAKIAEAILFLYIILFPFGQIIRLPIHPVDVVALFSLPYLFLFPARPRIAKYAAGFFLTCLFSLLLSLSIFSLNQIVLGSLYFLRVFGYFSLFLLTWNLVREKSSLRDLLNNSLLAVAAATAVFGWIQYMFYPDLRSLKIWGWDDHLYRLVGTFLDPGFTGIILALGGLLCLAKLFKTKSGKLVVLFSFLMISLAFTYSRAAYLALLVGVFSVGLLTKNIEKILIIIFSFLFLVVLLPRPQSEGVKLERLSSVYPRLGNYSESFAIFRRYPVFGIGYDNLCILRGRNPNESHACAGSDSSLLTIAATTGIVGLFIFFNLAREILGDVKKKYIYGTVASLVALGIDSLFINSLFYPWVMGWMAILMAVSLKE